MVEHVFGVPVGLGTVSNLHQELSAALRRPTEAADAVRAAAVKHVDETGWKENGRKRWLWLAATDGGRRVRHPPVAEPGGPAGPVGPGVDRHLVLGPVGGLQLLARAVDRSCAGCIERNWMALVDGRGDEADTSEVYELHHHEKVVAIVPDQHARWLLLEELAALSDVFEDWSGYYSEPDEGKPADDESGAQEV